MHTPVILSFAESLNLASNEIELPSITKYAGDCNEDEAPWLGESPATSSRVFPVVIPYQASYQFVYSFVLKITHFHILIALNHEGLFFMVSERDC